MARAKRQTKQQKLDAGKITEKNIKVKIEACLENDSKEEIAALYKKVRARKKTEVTDRETKKTTLRIYIPTSKAR